MSNNTFEIPDTLMARIISELRAGGHDAIADEIQKQHPTTLGATDKAQMGGGCSAYIVTVPCDGQNILIVWTDSNGMELPTVTDYMIGVYAGEITEDHLLLIDSD